MSNKPLYTAVALLSMTTLTAHAQDTAERDSLTREMVLEREYVPTTKMAKKMFFNPLDGTRSKALSPLNFVRNSYEVSMNVRPHLFAPVENSLATERHKNAWHLRLLGGYPMHYGANMGMLFSTSETGSLEVSVDHLSRRFDVSSRPSGFVPHNTTHDSSIGLKYAGKLSDRLYSVGGHLFNNLHTMYGYYPSDALQVTTPSEPFYGIRGGDLHFEISPAPLSLRSEWQYSLYGDVGYASKKDVQWDGALAEVIDPQDRLSGLDVEVGGSLAYGIMQYNVSVGMDALLASNRLYGYQFSGEKSATQMLSLDPYVSYIEDNFKLKAGARVQLLSFGPRKLLVAPRLDVRWDLNDRWALIADADGGAVMHSMRDLYQMNRYAQGYSSYDANDIAQLKASVGVQAGNFNGFSAEVKAGYADYVSMYQWIPMSRSMGPSAAAQSAEMLTYFEAADGGRVRNLFVTAEGRYLSPIGLQVSLGATVNSYDRSSSGDHNAREDAARFLSGRPSFEMNASLDYQILPSLSAHLGMTGLGGLRYLYTSSPSPASLRLPMILEVNARLSYKLHRNVGVSLIGLNLTNQKSARWLYYERGGATILGALTLQF